MSRPGGAPCHCAFVCVQAENRVFLAEDAEIAKKTKEHPRLCLVFLASFAAFARNYSSLWGRPPGLRGTPSSRSSLAESSLYLGREADEGVGRYNLRRRSAVGNMARSGTATVEFALVAPVLMLLLAAVLNGAMLLRTAVCAANAQGIARIMSEPASADEELRGRRCARCAFMPTPAGPDSSGTCSSGHRSPSRSTRPACPWDSTRHSADSCRRR